MKYSLDKWSVIIEDFDVKTELAENRDTIYNLLATCGLVIFKNQNLTKDDEYKILTQQFYINLDYHKDEVIDPIRGMFVDGSNFLMRVTAQKNSKGESGAFNDINGLPWHSDNPTNVDDRLLTWLYGYNSTTGSVTEYCNTNLAFENLNNDLKSLAKSLIAHTTNRFVYKDNTSCITPLYNHCGLGYYSWTFPYKQITQFVGYSIEESKDIISTLLPYVLQDQYCYTHHWEDNDLVISNERILIHRRPYYDKMDTRVLHKGTMGLLH